MRRNMLDFNYVSLFALQIQVQSVRRPHVPLEKNDAAENTTEELKKSVLYCQP